MTIATTHPTQASPRRPSWKHEIISPVVSKRTARQLLAQMKRLDEIRTVMTADGLNEEARSLATTIADLQWQYEELERMWLGAQSHRQGTYHD